LQNNILPKLRRPDLPILRTDRQRQRNQTLSNRLYKVRAFAIHQVFERSKLEAVQVYGFHPSGIFLNRKVDRDRHSAADMRRPEATISATIRFVLGCKGRPFSRSTYPAMDGVLSIFFDHL
jgi:hypothetical protein